MAALPSPKAPSSLVKFSRWTMLGLGFMYGSGRYALLKTKEEARRAKEEEERPAKEAAMKAEKEKRNEEEMAYLARETGVGQKGSASGAAATVGSSDDYRSECGCNY